MLTDDKKVSYTKDGRTIVQSTHREVIQRDTTAYISSVNILKDQFNRFRTQRLLISL